LGATELSSTIAKTSVVPVRAKSLSCVKGKAPRKRHQLSERAFAPAIMHTNPRSPRVELPSAARGSIG
jgi:hypothetical protein